MGDREGEVTGNGWRWKMGWDDGEGRGSELGNIGMGGGGKWC